MVQLRVAKPLSSSLPFPTPLGPATVDDPLSSRTPASIADDPVRLAIEVWIGYRGEAGPVMIETRRLTLRLVTEADKDDLIALERDPEVMRFLNGGKPTPADGLDDNVPFRMPRGREPDVWAGIEKDSSQFIGWFSLKAGPEAGAAELGYRLRRSAWGRGYAHEGAKALVGFGFRNLGLQRIWAETMAVNLASRRVMEKVGLDYVRTVHLDFLSALAGGEHGEVEYEITCEAWAKAPARPQGAGACPGC
jgi:RimJ/RimL family protein N-acetyltransferase